MFASLLGNGTIGLYVCLADLSFSATLKWMVVNLMMKTGHLKQVVQLQEDWTPEHLKPGYLLVFQNLEYEQYSIVLVLRPRLH